VAMTCAPKKDFQIWVICAILILVAKVMPNLLPHAQAVAFFVWTRISFKRKEFRMNKRCFSLERHMLDATTTYHVSMPRPMPCVRSNVAPDAMCHALKTSLMAKK
jgi:hypothetical protein